LTSLDLERSPYLDWGLASATLAGQSESGDACLVKAIETGLLLGVVDGLGHGAEAAVAAQRAVASLAHCGSDSVIVQLRQCHAALRGTRGVVMCLAALNVKDNTMTWIAVGNVEGVLARADQRTSRPMEAVVQRNGVVGERLPTLHASMTSIAPGDLLVFTTDGIRREFRRGLTAGPRPQELADRILSEHRKETDDALVLAAEYRGAGGRRA
jgi:serine/threonine protein phosphatase PrpC